MIAEGYTDGDYGLVLIDIGNTAVSLAVCEKGERAPADHVPPKPLDGILELLQQTWNELPVSQGRGVVISSVCPSALSQLRSECRRLDIEPLLVVGEELDLPMGVDLPEPEKVGTDRICAAAGAYIKVQSACVVADFGTALTIDLVSDNGVFLGGTIMPGMALSAQALHEHTALLPLVEVGAAEGILGTDTTSAIRNGIFAMMSGALREVTEGYATQIGKWPILVLTGGDARVIAQACDFVDRVYDDLCLDGLVIAYQQYVQKNGYA
ncbi:MAG: type III pantothenate kinase [Planctomycetota bacterium]|nr:MAG: type III pantothenate kinase [Planctomycetota bacterium]